MAINFQIPKISRFIQTANIFEAVFNVPVLGLYSFNQAGNKNQTVIALNTNSIYLIERINVGGDIPEEQYNENISLLPKAVLSFKIEGRVYPLPLPLVNYIDNQECTAWVWSDKGNDELRLTLDVGELAQNAFLVGRGSVKVFIAFNVYEISDNNFIQQFKGSSTAAAAPGFSAPMSTRNTIIPGRNFSRL